MTKQQLLTLIEAIPQEKRRWHRGTQSYDGGIFLDAGAFTGGCLAKFYDSHIQEYLLAVSPENLLRILSSSDETPTPPSKAISLPTWDACKAKADGGQKLSALEQFIYDNEPVPFADEESLFRTDLFAVVKELRSADEPDDH